MAFILQVLLTDLSLRAETKHLLGVEDGPSAALLRFMED